jgi:hypothetical protein
LSLNREKSPIKELSDFANQNKNSLLDEILTIKQLLTSNFPVIKSEELPLYQAFISLASPSSPCNSLESISKHLRSSVFHQNLQTLRHQILQNSFNSALLISSKFYSQVHRSLYINNLSKAISSFLENLYKSFRIEFKPVKFIEYFESLQSPSNFHLNPTIWSKMFVNDFNVETTKDDEENLYVNTAGDEKEYEDLMENEQVHVLNTEPDSKNSLVSMFFQKHETKNPYLDSRKLIKHEPCASRSEKWNKYFRESIFLKKLGQEFVQFICRKETWKSQSLDLVTWVYKNKSELIQEFLGLAQAPGEGISDLKYKAMIEHLADKKTLRDLFKGF